MKQTTVDRRKAFRKLWKDLGKRFLLMFGAGLLLVVVMPVTRLNPLAYLVAFLIAFAIAWVWMFRRKEVRKEFEGDD